MNVGATFSQGCKVMRTCHSFFFELFSQIMLNDGNLPKYMAFSAGGTYGFMYIGVVHALRDHIKSSGEFFDNIRGVSGVSAGALAALSMLLDKMDYLHKIIVDNVLHEFVANPDFALLLQEYGLSRGDMLRDIVCKLLREAGISEEVTFEGLRRLLRRDFVCVATVLETSQPIYFSYEHTPNAKVVDAVYSSMCVPFMLVPYKYEGNTLVDGVLSLQIADAFPPEETLFVDFDFSSFSLPINTFQQYCIACLTARTENLWYRRHQCLTLHLPDGIHPCDFNINNKEIEMRVTCGYANTVMIIYPSFMTCLTSCIMFAFYIINDSTQLGLEFGGGS